MKRVIALLLVIAFVIMFSSCDRLFAANASKQPKDVVAGKWVKKVDALGLAQVEINYTFYEDGTCKQSTDFNLTSHWSMIDDTHLKINTPLSFTEEYEIKQVDGEWRMIAESGAYYVRVTSSD